MTLFTRGRALASLGPESTLDYHVLCVLRARSQSANGPIRLSGHLLVQRTDHTFTTLALTTVESLSDGEPDAHGTQLFNSESVAQLTEYHIGSTSLSSRSFRYPSAFIPIVRLQVSAGWLPSPNSNSVSFAPAMPVYYSLLLSPPTG